MNRHTQNTLKYFESIGSSITGIINSPAAGDPRYRRYWKTKLNEIDRIIKEAKERWANFVAVEIPTAFRIEARKVQATYTKARFKRKAGRKWQPQAIRAVEDITILRLFDGLDAGRRDIARLFHLRQLVAIDRAKINDALAVQLKEARLGAGPLSEFEAADAIRQGLIGDGAGTPRAVRNEVLNALEKKIGKEGKIIVEQANGRRVHFRPETFAKKIARRGVATAQSRAALNTILEFGQDLLRITDHATNTPICLPFEGRVYSISGRHPDYPALVNLPPYHDNCQHGIAPFIEGSADSDRYRRQQKSIREVSRRNEKKLAAIEEKQVRKSA